MPSRTTSLEVADSMAGPVDGSMPRYAAPDWPGPSTSALIHLDFLVDDLVATEALPVPSVRAGSTSSPTRGTASSSLIPTVIRSA